MHDQGISPRFSNTQPLKCGMILSNEPGYYRAGCFGIRIENLLAVCPASEVVSRVEGKQFFKFDKLTVIPIQKSLIDVSLLTSREVDWINEYHSDIWERVSPLVNSETQEWLRESTTPLSVP